MKPLLAIFFILLFLPGMAQAADGEKLKIIPAPMNFTESESELDLNGTENINPITNPAIRINDTGEHINTLLTPVC